MFNQEFYHPKGLRPWRWIRFICFMEPPETASGFHEEKNWPWQIRFHGPETILLWALPMHYVFVFTAMHAHLCVVSMFLVLHNLRVLLSIMLCRIIVFYVFSMWCCYLLCFLSSFYLLLFLCSPAWQCHLITPSTWWNEVRTWRKAKL